MSASIQTAHWKRPENRWFWFFVLVLVGLRFVHFGELLDSPHLWRQSDTANYIWDFYENGIDLLHPAVNWRGGHKTLILEFPLHEAICAVFYKVFGPSHLWARLVTIAFYLMSCVYLFKIIHLVANERLAQLSTVIYMALPLSLFYSRAVHIDFMVVAFSHAMLWYFLQGIAQKKAKWMLVATLFSIPAFLMKAPYVFYLALPLAVYVHQQKKWRFALRWSWLIILPASLFVWWIWHTKTVNAQAPDWSFIPDYHKFTHMFLWYFGTMEQRLDGQNWLLLGERLLTVVAGITGTFFALTGLIVGRKATGYRFFAWWLIAVVTYVLIFFNLNRVHDYYQIPLLAPLAVMMAYAGVFIYDKFLARHNIKASLWAVAFLIVAESGVYAFTRFYKINYEQQNVGTAIEEATEKEDLIILSWGGLGANFPNVFYNARRNGWSIMQDFMKPELCYRLYQEGATHLALVRHTPPEGEMAQFTQVFEAPRVTQVADDGLKVYVYHLDPSKLEPQ